MAGEHYLEELWRIVEANGGKLLSTEWKGNAEKYRFAVADGREFEMRLGDLRRYGWPKNLDLYFRRYSKERGAFHMEDMRRIAETHGGRLLSTEWGGGAEKYWFEDQAGIRFQITANGLKRGGWSPDAGVVSETVCRQAMQHLFGVEFTKTRAVVKRIGKPPLELDGYADFVSLKHGVYRIAFEYQGHQGHRINPVVIARDCTKKMFCAQSGIILIVIDPFRQKNPWESDYVLAHIQQAIATAFIAVGLETPELNAAPFEVDMKVIHKAIVGIVELKEFAKSNGGKLLSTEWKGGNAKYRFAFADGREFSMLATTIRCRGWPKDPDGYLRTYDDNRGLIHLEDMRRIAEANGGKLLSTEWGGADIKYRFAFADGREFETVPATLKLLGWPQDPDLYFRHGNNPDRGNFHLEDMRRIAEANGGQLLSTEWKGNSEKYRFAFADGREFETVPATLKLLGWPQDPDLYFRHGNNPDRGNFHLEDMRRIAEANGGQLLSTEWQGADIKYRFAFADGREFERLPGNLKRNGWPQDPDLYFRKGPAHSNSADIFLNELRQIAEANGGKLLSTEWKGGAEKYRFAFADGREFWRSSNDMRKCGWPKNQLEQLRQIAEANGGKLLSTEWKGNAEKYRFAFADGREFKRNANGLKTKGWPKDPDRYFKHIDTLTKKQTHEARP